MGDRRGRRTTRAGMDSERGAGRRVDPRRAMAGFAALALSAAAMLPAPPARACSCAWAAFDLLRPADGETGVPRNARVWVGGDHGPFGGDDWPALAVVDDTGAPVAGETTQLWGAGDGRLVAVFTPDGDLEPQHGYEVWGGDQLLTTFTTGTSVDEQSPPAPLEIDRETYGDPGLPQTAAPCGGASGATFTLDAEGLFVLVDLDEQSTFDPDRLEGQLSDLEADPDAVVVSSFLCDGGWRQALAGSTGELRFATVDLAGNVSPWSEPAQVTIPPPGCRCSNAASTRPGAPALLAAALLATAVVRRRARPRPPAR